jgi:hypothetical protein
MQKLSVNRNVDALIEDMIALVKNLYSGIVQRAIKPGCQAISNILSRRLLIPNPDNRLSFELAIQLRLAVQTTSNLKDPVSNGISH